MSWIKFRLFIHWLFFLFQIIYSAMQWGEKSYQRERKSLQFRIYYYLIFAIDKSMNHLSAYNRRIMLGHTFGSFLVKTYFKPMRNLFRSENSLASIQLMNWLDEDAKILYNPKLLSTKYIMNILNNRNSFELWDCETAKHEGYKKKIRFISIL